MNLTSHPLLTERSPALRAGTHLPRAHTILAFGARECRGVSQSPIGRGVKGEEAKEQ